MNNLYAGRPWDVPWYMEPYRWVPASRPARRQYVDAMVWLQSEPIRTVATFETWEDALDWTHKQQHEVLLVHVMKGKVIQSQRIADDPTARIRTPLSEECIVARLHDDKYTSVSFEQWDDAVNWAHWQVRDVLLVQIVGGQVVQSRTFAPRLIVHYNCWRGWFGKRLQAFDIETRQRVCAASSPSRLLLNLQQRGYAVNEIAWNVPGMFGREWVYCQECGHVQNPNEHEASPICGKCLSRYFNAEKEWTGVGGSVGDAPLPDDVLDRRVQPYQVRSLVGWRQPGTSCDSLEEARNAANTWGGQDVEIVHVFPDGAEHIIPPPWNDDVMTAIVRLHPEEKWRLEAIESNTNKPLEVNNAPINEFCAQLRARGYAVVLDPEFVKWRDQQAAMHFVQMSYMALGVERRPRWQSLLWQYFFRDLWTKREYERALAAVSHNSTRGDI